MRWMTIGCALLLTASSLAMTGCCCDCQTFGPSEAAVPFDDDDDRKSQRKKRRKKGRKKTGNKNDKKAASKKNDAAQSDTLAVLWLDQDGARAAWRIEREGKTLKMHWGPRTSMRYNPQTSEITLDSTKEAKKRFKTEVDTKLKEGYRRLPSGDHLKAEVEKKLGIKLASLKPPIVKSSKRPAKNADDHQRFMAKDLITGVGVQGRDDFCHVFTIEGLAEALKLHKNSTYIWYERPSTRLNASVPIRL